MIFEINRDFLYQVALSFDEIAMEVLAWLDDRSFEWDMYVDLPASAVRYCFRTLADATAFRQRFVHATQKPPQAAVVKSDGGERCGNGGTRSRQARLREASASKPLMTCRKRISCHGRLAHSKA